MSSTYLISKDRRSSARVSCSPALLVRCNSKLATWRHRHTPSREGATGKHGSHDNYLAKRRFWALVRTGQGTELKGNDPINGYLLLVTIFRWQVGHNRYWAHSLLRLSSPHSDTDDTSPGWLGIAGDQVAQKRGTDSPGIAPHGIGLSKST